MKHDPDFSVPGIPRICGLDMSKDPYVVCHKVASKHIVWNSKPRFSYVCPKHEAEVLGNNRYWMAHKMGPYCGMPGSVFIPEENICKMSKEGLPIVGKSTELPARSLKDFVWKR